MARLGAAKVAKKPSPVVFTSRPSNRLSCRRTAASWVASRSRQRWSPSSAARTVEPTMSVNMTVASTRLEWVSWRTPVRNCSISSTIGSGSSINRMWSSPGNSTIWAPGIRWAM